MKLAGTDRKQQTMKSLIRKSQVKLDCKWKNSESTNEK